MQVLEILINTQHPKSSNSTSMEKVNASNCTTYLDDVLFFTLPFIPTNNLHNLLTCNLNNTKLVYFRVVKKTDNSYNIISPESAFLCFKSNILHVYESFTSGLKMELIRK